MSLSRASRQYLGVRALLPPDLQTATRSPTSADRAYVKGTLWLDTAAATAFMWPGTGDWISLGSGTTGAIVTLTGDSGGPISPVSGNIDILGGAGVTVAGTAGTLTISLTGGGLAIDSFVPDAGTDPVVPSALGVVTMAGTASQITTTGGLNSLTFSIPSAFIAPGSIASTTTITSGTGITSTLGNIVASAGSVDATLGAVSAGTTVTAGTGVTATTGDITASAGDIVATLGDITAAAGDIEATLGSVAAGTSVTAGTTVTATLGAITATDGNVVLGTAGNKILVAEGANASAGVSGVMSGTPGEVSVATTACSATARVFYARATTGGTPGHVSITAQDGTGFTLTSTGNETSTFNWWIINA